jgi:hypothetical protein
MKSLSVLHFSIKPFLVQYAYCLEPSSFGVTDSPVPLEFLHDQALASLT